MYAVVKINGFQYKVQKNDVLLVPFDKNRQVGDHLSFNEVLLLDDGEQLRVGTPYVDGARVEAEVLDFKKGEKIISFKKKRRKGYHRKKGFRAKYMELRVLDIVQG